MLFRSVADRLAIQQMKVQLNMQQTYFALMQKIGDERIRQLRLSAEANEREAKALKEQAALLRQQGKTTEAETIELRAQIAARQALQDSFDAEHAQKSLNLAKTKELAEEEKQRVAIQNQLEESQNRLYTSLKEWADLLASSVQSLFEASNAGNAEYYNELAKLNLTGKGGPGAGTYIVIDNEGTSDAKAHYEYLDEREALERQHEIEQENAQAEAWKKVMDDLNQKMSEQITDWMNATLQNQAIDTNTAALNTLTGAVNNLAGVMGGQPTGDGYTRNAEGMAVDSSGNVVYPVQPTEPTVEGSEAPSWKPFWQMTDEEKAQHQDNMTEMFGMYRDMSVQTEAEKAELLAEIPGYQPSAITLTDEQIDATGEKLKTLNQKQIEADKELTNVKLENQQKVKQGEQQADAQMVKTNKASFAAMTAAANMYGIAYQAMSNDNLTTSQRVQMMIVQAAGQAAMTMLTVAMAADTAETAMHAPAWISKTLKDLGPIGGPIAVGVFTALIGGLMGVATSKITKSKSQIAQATGASSASAGKLSTGMLTYAEGNVNEFTDPASLTPGKQYNVDAADGRTYRARYMGSNPKTHITNGPEFHLSGERGREMIIDAGTTRQITMNEGEIWHAIQTLSGGGRLRHSQARRSGMRAFADGNVDEFEDMTTDSGFDSGSGMSTEMLASLQASIDRQSDLLEHAIQNGIKAVNKWTGPDGIPNMVNEYNKKAARHGEKYL